MKIKEVSKITGLTSHTLRYYEKIGLVRHIERNSSGLRVYTDQDLIWIDFLTKMKLTRMPLKELIHYADSYYSEDKDMETRIELLLNHKQRILTEIKSMESSLECIDYKINKYKNRMDIQPKKTS